MLRTQATRPLLTHSGQWVPTPAASYNLVARVFGASESAMSGTWLLPKPEPFASRALTL
jgi:hypothetical protein